MNNLMNENDSYPHACEATEPHAQAMLRILLECINAGQDDAEQCRRLGIYVAEQTMAGFTKTDLLPLCVHSSALWTALDFIINEYGEPVSECYMGRDEDGEKTYHTYNPETNWNERTRKVIWPLLRAGGYVCEVRFESVA